MDKQKRLMVTFYFHLKAGQWVTLWDQNPGCMCKLPNKKIHVKLAIDIFQKVGYKKMGTQTEEEGVMQFSGEKQD